ncbi:ABC1 kinase family protein [Chondromyces apiculatus]|uniref:Ubiquinone biosynthesis monooxygenase UbiB n=1 Tax=Chondromyces apiculatus DSM 436 TaxID=1192034 RepID=A0A017TBQ2_9BACT|nr:AarF/ABC1/UbiB kinase family protein [Chondromyces apiculatus]EYF06659.1 Ubiquinone biosynthesis monooxygenase UbiB [Chondromyces apiculatus DSM 436]
MPSIVAAVRDLNRLRQIYLVLVRHGFGEIGQRLGFRGRSKSEPDPKALPAAADSRRGEGESIDVFVPEEAQKQGEEARRKISPAERVRLCAMDLGPSFVKLGQIASTRPDLLPPEWIVELKKLQDEVTPLPFKDIEAAVETALGAPITDLYERFDERPLAAASIGQVHRAVLRHPEGPREVVVKVQRPGIRSTVTSDLELLHALATLIERVIPESRIYSPSELVDQFDRAITSELDFLLEADNAARFSRNFAGYRPVDTSEPPPDAAAPGAITGDLASTSRSSVRFPFVYRQASAKQVLTLEYLPGFKVYDAIREHGHEGPLIAKASVGILIKMIFEDGFFHADPHPGNILIMGTPAQPIFGFIDLGMVGRLSPEMRDRTIDLMIAAVRQDHLGVADALYAIGTPTRKIDMRAYRAHVSVLAEKYLGRPLKEIDLAAMLADLINGATKFGIEIPPDFFLVGKALMTIEGVGKELDPDLDVFGEARPYFLDLLRRRYSPERIGMDLWRGVERLSTTAYDLPQQTREILEELRLGRLTVHTSDTSLPQVVDRLGRRLFAGLVVGAFLLSGTWLIATGAQIILGAVLLGSGLAYLLLHVAQDLLKRWR